MRPTAMAAKTHPIPTKKATNDAGERPNQSLTPWNSKALRNSSGCIQIGIGPAVALVEREPPQTWQKRAPTMNSEPQPAQAFSRAGNDWGWATGGCQNSWVGLWTACDMAI